MLTRLLLACVLIGSASCLLYAQDKSSAKSLDEQLLEGLDSELLPAASKKTSAPSVEKKADEPRAKPSGDAGLDQKLLDEIEGEDIELGKQPIDPLTRIGKTMRQVETLIDRHDTSSRTQDMQKQIVRDLELLLEQTKKQCQGGQSKPSASPSQQAAKPANGNKPSEGEPSSKPARDSTDRLAKAGKTDAEDDKDMDALVKQVWGHLPEKVRDQMQNVGVENFLPKYEKLIEDYYRRLAEETR